MKIGNLPPIHRYVIFLAVLCFAVLAACSAGKKDSVTEKQTEEFLVQVEQTKKDGEPNRNAAFDAPERKETESFQQQKTVTLTNSEPVNHELFPVRLDHFQEYVGLGGPPNYLENEEDWVVFTDDRRNGGMHGLTLHLKNLPQEFDVLIYTPDESSHLTFSGKKEEFNIEEYKDFFLPEERKPLERILPMYTFYYPAPFTAFLGKQKTEIRSKDNALIFSTYLAYPDDPFRIQTLQDRFFQVQYSSDAPFYLVVYEAAPEAILSSGDEGYKRIPVGAFAVYPKTDIWEGILSLGAGFSNMNIHRIYLYRLDESNPADYTQAIEGSWNNFIRID